MPGSLFSEFGPSSKDAWEKLAQKELKGRLHELPPWAIADELSFEPYVTSQQTELEKMAAMQRCQKKTPGWINMPEVTFTDPRKTNANIKNALANGADAIVLNLRDTELNRCEFPKLLHSLRLSDTPVFFQTGQNSGQLFSEISRHAGYYLKGGVAFDPVAEWMRTAKPFDESINAISELLHHTKNMREFRPYMVQTHLYHDQGASPVQELAYGIAATVTYMDLLTNNGVAPLLAFNRILFSVSVGTQYLTEIAKLRAFRYLLRNISRAYGLPDALCAPFLRARTSSFYHCGSSPHTNMIRACSEAMSAVIGGCNALTVQAFDQHRSVHTDFSERIARNVSSVLSYESALGVVADPAAGSYMLEDMSCKLADAAWKLFLDMEEKGGLIKCFENGLIQIELKKSLEQKVNALNHDQVMVGVNRFTEPGETAQNNTVHLDTNTTQPFTILNDRSSLSDYFHQHSLTKK
ncbi:MAG: methylmalonyl-CoA mutase family protein [Dyadobacter sp.]|uniref:methylmalonyl-CoA mutase family protein n=1 Tax=Dyadobacter sp. TaxID=1914288 RepID=UPI003263EE73